MTNKGEETAGDRERLRGVEREGGRGREGERGRERNREIKTRRASGRN